MQGLTLFITLVFIALICIAMGAGIPTTALYIVLAAIAAPAVQQLGVPPLAAHLFILYYGILADLTPPVCVAAYAAAGIAGVEPVPHGDHGVPARHGEGDGALRLRLCAGDAHHGG